MLEIEMKEMFRKLFEEIGSIKTELGSVKTELGSVKTELRSVKTDLQLEIKHNLVILESVQSNIKTIAEVQKAHMDQNERDHEKIIKHIEDKTELMGSVLKSVSAKIQDSEEVQKRHGEEILTLKRKIG